MFSPEQKWGCEINRLFPVMFPFCLFLDDVSNSYLFIFYIVYIFLCCKKCIQECEKNSVLQLTQWENKISQLNVVDN